MSLSLPSAMYTYGKSAGRALGILGDIHSRTYVLMHMYVHIHTCGLLGGRVRFYIGKCEVRVLGLAC